MTGNIHENGGIDAFIFEPTGEEFDGNSDDKVS